MKVVSGRTMRELDRQTIAAGTPGLELMERAGQGAFQELLAWVEGLDSRHAIQFVVVTGKGNNGGDGFVVARCLAELTDYPVTVCSICPRRALTGEARAMADRLPDTVRWREVDSLPADCLRPGVVLVDALLGTGIAGPVREPYATLIAEINASGLPVVALDLPSGIQADDGSSVGAAVMADLTITFGLPKTGHFLGAGLAHRGQLRMVDIGLLPAAVAATTSPFAAVAAADVRPFLGRLAKGSHKGTRGRILIVGGASQYPGAPVLAACGALRAGGGLVTLAHPAAMAPLLTHAPAALIRQPLPDGGAGCHSLAAGADYAGLAARQDVLAIGPGLARAPESLAVVQALLATDRPAVVDADGLAVVGHAVEVLPRAATTVLTPHPGEMARLLTALGLEELAQADRLVQASRVAARLGAYVVLKGPATVLAAPDGRLALNTSGTPGLATGGSGDVLTGIIAAFLAVADEPWTAVQAAVFLHGLAAERAPHGQRHLIADDLPQLLGEAMQEVSPFA